MLSFIQMQGTNNQPGVIPLTINYCFEAIQNYSNREFLFRVSYLEVLINCLFLLPICIHTNIIFPSILLYRCITSKSKTY